MATQEPRHVAIVDQVASLPAGSFRPEPVRLVGVLPASAVPAAPAATQTTAGSVKEAAHVAPASGAADASYDATTQATIQNLQTQFNALLTALQNAGIVSAV